MWRARTTVCNENRPTAEFDRFEFRNSRLIVGCKCARNDGMQHECERSKCMAGRPLCLTYPAPTCLPSRPCPPRPQVILQDIGHRDKSGAESQSSHRPVDSGTRGVGDGGGVGGGVGTVGGRLSERNSRYRPFNARRMRKWAVDQYDDRPALRKFFRPCRVHCVVKKQATADICANKTSK